MATYVNDLRLKEIATGDESGTWGTSTNTNLELIANAMGVGAEAVANASTHTITMADGTADEFRSTFLRLTGGGQACTVTLAPNTLSHTWIMRNETAAALTLTQGSGANVVIAAGQTKIVATDGAGSGAVVYEMDDLELAGNLLVGGTLGVTGVLTATSLDISGDIDVDGTANLDVVDIDGAVNMATTALVTGVLTTTAATVFNGGFASNAASTITVADNSNNLTLTSTDGDANAGPKLDLYRNSTSPADGDLLGRINFRGRNDNSQDVDYAAWVSRISDASDGSEDGILRADILAAGAVVDVLTLYGTEVVVNESHADVDFRVESDNNTHALFVQGSDGNVGINSAESFAALDGVTGVQIGNSSATSAGIALETDDRGYLLYVPGDVLSFWDSSANSDRMRIDSSGNVLIGTTASGSAGLNVGNSINIGFSEGTNSSLANIFRQSSSGGTIVASGYKVTSTANKFESSFASAWARTAIGCFYGGIRFYADAEATVAVGTDITPTERMRIDSSGNLLLGTTTLQGRITVTATGSTTIDCARTETSTANNIVFRNGNGAVGSIQTSGSATAYNTSSDQRLKENIADADDAGSKVDAIQVRKFDWKVDGSHQDYGMVAQELQVVAPEAVSASEDPDEMMSVDYSKLVPMLVKEIQSLRARVNALESEG